ncbi:MAG: adenosylcobinamide-GDP ribazoletransferase [Candidatus Margulisiibacteriota bacterium]
MKSFLLALQFLTIIPLKIESFKEQDLAESSKYFPLVGFLLGLILAGAYRLLLLLNFEPISINIIVVLLLVALTGGLHLDGLADTSDAFLSRKNKEQMLKIMRDSHIGVMGVLSIISIILLKISFLSSISISSKLVALILMCILSRWCLVFSILLFPYAREEGKAKIFFQGINLKIFSLATLITLSFVLLTWQLKGLIVFLITAISTYIIGKFIKNIFNGITGDTLGTINELIEVLVLFSICIMERISLWIT